MNIQNELDGRSKKMSKKRKKKRKRNNFKKPKHGKSFLEKCPIKFGLGTIRKWSKDNPCGPGEVGACCDKKFKFDCKGCGHTIGMRLNNIMKGRSCGHCSKQPTYTPLCGKIECSFCFKKSFASLPDEPFYQQKLREYNQCVPDENPPAHTVKRCSNEKFNFLCEACGHTYPMRLNHVTNQQRGCGYCDNKKRCGKPACDFCTAHSVAANPIMLERWDRTRNKKTPYEVALNSHKKYWFTCEHGHSSYDQKPHNANQLGHGCPDCKNKTEGLIRDFLTEIFGSKCFGIKSFEWCRHIKKLPFDIHLKHFKILIECDGPQHFVRIKHFNRDKTLEDIQERDRYKETCANSNGFWVTRIKQEDVWHDRNDWREKLLGAIQKCRESDTPFVELLY